MAFGYAGEQLHSRQRLLHCLKVLWLNTMLTAIAVVTFGLDNLEAVVNLLICQQAEKWTVSAKITGELLNRIKTKNIWFSISHLVFGQGGFLFCIKREEFCNAEDFEEAMEEYKRSLETLKERKYKRMTLGELWKIVQQQSEL